MSGDTDDRWDRGDSHTTWEVEGLRIVKQYGDFAIEGPVNVGDQFWVVYAIYSTGDSFGHDSGNSFEPFTIHRNAEYASANETILYKHSGDWDVPIWDNDTGVMKKAFIPWLGYFESLDDVRCELLTVKE